MNLLFKYVSPERIDDLLDGKIRFTQPGAFNDPFEIPAFKLIDATTLIGPLSEAMRESARAAAATGGLATVATITGFAPAEQLSSSRISKVFQLPSSTGTSFPNSSLDLLAGTGESLAAEPPQDIDGDDDKKQIINNKIESIDKMYGILSLTAVKDNLLMWAHYSGEHRGAVIAIDIEDDKFVQGAKGFQEQGDVEYTSFRPGLPMNEGIIMKHFFTKSREWEYEKEYRIVRQLRYATERKHTSELQDIFLFDLPPRCIRRLIFGVRCEEQQKKQIISRISGSPELEHISLWQAYLDPSRFRLRIDRIPSRS